MKSLWKSTSISIPTQNYSLSLYAAAGAQLFPWPFYCGAGRDNFNRFMAAATPLRKKSTTPMNY
jgi:hypothetical protein